ncbi:DUF6350 family protein [uncultured Corynebacterium sp.]|uniref:cell division protein PerM n=1 Tax=uncultured Corynebacterium sp. TaxID=159447 RepID=UPI0028E885DC|nr:DUF6350 family protein [uncultured Corynebacterium sp.]
MSKKSSPGAGPTRRPRRTGSRADAAGVGLATRSVGSTRSPRSTRFARPARPSSRPDSRSDSSMRKTTTRHVEPEIEPAIPTLRTRIRTYLPVALLPNGVAVAFLIALGIAGIMLVNASMAILPAVIAQSWLALNAAPIIIQGHHFGIMPLLLTAIIVALVAHRVRRAVKDRVSLADLGVITMVVLIVPSVLTLIAAAMLYDAAKVFPVTPPNIAMALGKTLLVHFIALVLGMGVRLWKALAKRLNIAESLVDQAVSSLWIVGYALVGAALVGVGSMIVHAQLTGDIMDTYTTWGKVAVVVVCLGYLPNAAIAALAVTAGSEVAIGAGLISVFGVNLVPLPPLPMFAAVPLQTDTMMALLLIVPVCATVLALMKRVPRLIDVPGLVVFVALDILILTTLTYGELGIYGEVGPRILLTTGLMACWVTVVGLIIAIVGNWVQRRLVAAAAAAQREAELFDEFSALAISESESELEPQSESTEPETEEGHEDAKADDDAAADPDEESAADSEDAESKTTEDAEEVKPDGGAVAASEDADEDSWPNEAPTAVKDAAGPEISAETVTAKDSDADVTVDGEVEPGDKNH